MKTAECVTPRHPDKMCDIISDAILDSYLKQDSESRVAVEVMGGHKKVYISGEVTSKGDVLLEEVIKIVERVTGKKDNEVFLDIIKQSPDIARGVDTGGAGDQGIMVGYACNENEEMIPQELYLARSLCKFIYNKHPEDGKTQITLNKKDRIKTIVASFCNVKKEELKKIITEWFLDKDISKKMILHINPAGDWTQGGFDADTGLTGRKLVVDNYGTRVAIGGGAFSGKDSSKVDRSGAYVARKIAVDNLRIYNAKEVLVKIAYSIGVAEPVMVTVDIDGARKEIKEIQGLEPREIIDYLCLQSPIFEESAKWGHFGNKFNWDK